MSNGAKPLNFFLHINRDHDIVSLPSFLSAAFKVIKALLPPKAVEILKMISKKDVTQYIPKDNCLVSWGGGDSYEFSFEPEVRRLPAKSPATATTTDDDQFADRKVSEPEGVSNLALSGPTTLTKYTRQFQISSGCGACSRKKSSVV